MNAGCEASETITLSIRCRVETRLIERFGNSSPRMNAGAFLPVFCKQMSREAEPISSVSRVGSVSEEQFRAIGIYIDAELIRRVESSSVQTILEEIKQNSPDARLSVTHIEKIYENAKAKYIPTSEEVGVSLD